VENLKEEEKNEVSRQEVVNARWVNPCVNNYSGMLGLTDPVILEEVTILDMLHSDGFIDNYLSDRFADYRSKGNKTEALELGGGVGRVGRETL
jgi:hypothetical protein